MHQRCSQQLTKIIDNKILGYQILHIQQMKTYFQKVKLRNIKVKMVAVGYSIEITCDYLSQTIDQIWSHSVYCALLFATTVLHGFGI